MINTQIIEEIKNRLIKTYDPWAIYIFGSYAWGHPDEESDLDVLIIVDRIQPEERYHIMSKGYKALYGLNIAKDILVISKNEFEKYSQEPLKIYHKIKFQGKKIYARA